MSSEPKVDYDALAALALLATSAAQQVAAGDPDELVIPMVNCPVLPGEQDDEGVRAIPAIDVLRHLVENYARGCTDFGVEVHVGRHPDRPTQERLASRQPAESHYASHPVRWPAGALTSDSHLPSGRGSASQCDSDRVETDDLGGAFYH